jgi:hypothetical protein
VHQNCALLHLSCTWYHCEVNGVISCTQLDLQELRDNNTINLDDDDMARRKDDAHKARKKFIPSGGLAGFRVASDLAKMDFGAAEESD